MAAIKLHGQKQSRLLVEEMELARQDADYFPGTAVDHEPPPDYGRCAAEFRLSQYPNVSTTVSGLPGESSRCEKRRPSTG